MKSRFLIVCGRTWALGSRKTNDAGRSSRCFQEGFSPAARSFDVGHDAPGSRTSPAAHKDSMNRDQDPMLIVDYDSRWPDQFSILASRVMSVLGSLVLQVEHIGSTAVPGLAAKPVIDLDVVLASQSNLPEAIGRLGVLGYVHEGTLGIVGREAFRWPPSQARHHLYMLTADAVELRRHLAFRDAMRADFAVRDAYAALKRSLALRYPHDRKSYADGKSGFITQVLGGLSVAQGLAATAP
jgi:GrpB-like predicted nucleotidyltransferase (UPF0157 family)